MYYVRWKYLVWLIFVLIGDYEIFNMENFPNYGKSVYKY